MVHTKCYLIHICSTIVLSNGCPGMTKRIKAIIFLLGHSHILAYSPDSHIYIGIETIGITITTMKLNRYSSVWSVDRYLLNVSCINGSIRISMYASSLRLCLVFALLYPIIPFYNLSFQFVKVYRVNTTHTQ